MADSNGIGDDTGDLSAEITDADSDTTVDINDLDPSEEPSTQSVEQQIIANTPVVPSNVVVTTDGHKLASHVVGAYLFNEVKGGELPKPHISKQPLDPVKPPQRVKSSDGTWVEVASRGTADTSVAVTMRVPSSVTAAGVAVKHKGSARDYQQTQPDVKADLLVLGADAQLTVDDADKARANIAASKDSAKFKEQGRNLIYGALKGALTPEDQEEIKERMGEFYRTTEEVTISQGDLYANSPAVLSEDKIRELNPSVEVFRTDHKEFYEHFNVNPIVTPGRGLTDLEKEGIERDRFSALGYKGSEYGNLSSLDKDIILEQSSIRVGEYQEYKGMMEVARLGGISYEEYSALPEHDVYGRYSRDQWRSERIQHYGGNFLEQRRIDRAEEARKAEGYINRDYSGAVKQAEARSLYAHAGPFADVLGEVDATRVKDRVADYYDRVRSEVVVSRLNLDPKSFDEIFDEENLTAARLGVDPKAWSQFSRLQRSSVISSKSDEWEDRKLDEEAAWIDKIEAKQKVEATKIAVEQGVTIEKIRSKAEIKPQPNFPIQGRIVAVDTETTGFHPERGDRMVEIAATEIINGVVGKTFQTYITQTRESSTGALAVHGKDVEFLRKHGIPEEQAIQDLSIFVGGDAVWIHKLDFDKPFLEGAGFVFEQEGIDSIAVSKEVRGVGGKHNLDALAVAVGVDPKLIKQRAEEGHGAGIDTIVQAHAIVGLANYTAEQVDKNYQGDLAHDTALLAANINYNPMLAANIKGLFSHEIHTFSGVTRAQALKAGDEFIDVISGGGDFSQNIYGLEIDEKDLGEGQTVGSVLDEYNRRIFKYDFAEYLKADPTQASNYSKDIATTMAKLGGASNVTDRSIGSTTGTVSLGTKNLDVVTNRIDAILTELAQPYIDDRSRGTSFGESLEAKLKIEIMNRHRSKTFYAPFNKDGSYAYSSEILALPNELNVAGTVNVLGSHYGVKSGYTPIGWDLKKAEIINYYGSEDNIPEDLARRLQGQKPNRKNTLSPIGKDDRGYYKSFGFTTEVAKARQNKEHERLLGLAWELEGYKPYFTSVQGEAEGIPYEYATSVEQKEREQFREEAASLLGMPTAALGLDYTTGAEGLDTSQSVLFVNERSWGSDIKESLEVATRGYEGSDVNFELGVKVGELRSKSLENYEAIEREYVHLRKTGLNIDDTIVTLENMGNISHIEVDYARIEEQFGEGIREALNPGQRTAAWYKLRRGNITASAVGKLVSPTGKLKFDKIDEVAAELVLQRRGNEAPTLVTDWMVMGTKHEDRVKTAFLARHGHGREFEEAYFTTHPDTPGFGASPDGILRNPDGSSAGIIEFKYLSNTDPGSWKKHYVQMQLAMLESKEDRTHYFALNRFDESKSEYKIVYADKAFQKKILEIGRATLDASESLTVEQAREIKDNTTSLKSKLKAVDREIDKIEYDRLVRGIMDDVSFEPAADEPQTVFIDDMSPLDAEGMMERYSQLGSTAYREVRMGETTVDWDSRIDRAVKERAELDARYRKMDRAKFEATLEDKTDAEKATLGKARGKFEASGGGRLQRAVEIEAIRLEELKNQKINIINTDPGADREKRAKEVSLRNEIQTQAKDAFENDLASKSMKGLDRFEQMEQQGSGDAAQLISEYKKAQAAHTAGLRESTKQVRDFSRALKKVGGGISKVGSLGMSGVDSIVRDDILSDLTGLDDENARGIKWELRESGLSEERAERMMLNSSDQLTELKLHPSNYVEAIKKFTIANRGKYDIDFKTWPEINEMDSKEFSAYKAESLGKITDADDRLNFAKALGGDRESVLWGRIDPEAIRTRTETVKADEALRVKYAEESIRQVGQKILESPVGNVPDYLLPGTKVAGDALSATGEVLGMASSIAITGASAKYLMGGSSATAAATAGARTGLLATRAAGALSMVGKTSLPGLAAGLVYGGSKVARNALDIEDDGGRGDSMLDILETTSMGAGIGGTIGLVGGLPGAAIGAAVGGAVGGLGQSIYEGYQYLTEPKSELGIKDDGSTLGATGEGSVVVNLKSNITFDGDTMTEKVSNKGQLLATNYQRLENTPWSGSQS